MVCFISVPVCPVIPLFGLLKDLRVFLRLLVPAVSNCDRTPDLNSYFRVSTLRFVSRFFLSGLFPLCLPYGSPPSPGIPPPPAGAGGEITRGPHQTVSGPRKPHHLPGRRALCVLRCQFKHRVQSAVVRGWPLSDIHRLCGVDTG